MALPLLFVFFTYFLLVILIPKISSRFNIRGCYPQKNKSIFNCQRARQGHKWLCFLVCDIVCYGHCEPLINQKLIVTKLCFQKELTKRGLGGEQEFKRWVPLNSNTKHRVSEQGGVCEDDFQFYLSGWPSFNSHHFKFLSKRKRSQFPSFPHSLLIKHFPKFFVIIDPEEFLYH